MAQQTEHIGDTNKMMTAVDYIFKKIDVLDEISSIPISVTATKEIWKDIYKLAKAMEKGQIENTFADGFVEGVQTQKSGKQLLFPEQYYNETYNK
jgi:hypothetical protein